MILPTQLTKEDMSRCFDYFKRLNAEVVKIIANPVLEDVLFSVGVSVPVEYSETELGLRFVGRSYGDSKDQYVDESLLLRILDEPSLQKFKEMLQCKDESDLVPQRFIRIWKWNDAPECLKQFFEQGGDEDWVLLLSPFLFEDPVSWSGFTSVFGEDKVHYLLPGGWQIYIVANH